MVNIINKDEATIITIIPEDKDEEKLLRQIRDFQSQKEHKQSAYDYWTIKPKAQKQISLDDFASGFSPVEEDNPFAKKEGA